MKKILFIFISFIFSMGTCLAFDIDVDKITVDAKGNFLTKNLNKAYNIDVTGFDKGIVNDERVTNLAKELTKISLSDDGLDIRKKEFVKHLYLSSTSGGETLSGSLFVDLYLKKIDELELQADYIKDIRTVSFNQNDVISFVYLTDCTVKGEKKEAVLVFWMKKSNEEFKIYYPWLTVDEDLEEHFNTVSKKEDEGNIIGGTYNQLSLSGNGNVVVSDDILKKIYNDNKNSVVQITGMKDNGVSTYGSGFFIREGVVVTTWSLFLNILNNSSYVYVNDESGNTYNVLGVVAAQIDYDVVVLKIDKNNGKGVNFGDTNLLKLDDKLFMINSKNNANFSINYGSFISLDNGRMKNMFLINSGDVGGALFNQDGLVVGISVADQLNSELSYANSTDLSKDSACR